MADTKLTPEEQAELDQLNGVTSRKLSKSDQEELDELNGVKKKVDTTPLPSGSESGTFKSTTGVSAQSIQKISDFAPEGSKKLVQPTPFTVPAATVKETVERIEDKKAFKDVANIKGVDKTMLAEKLNKKMFDLEADLGNDITALEQTQQTYTNLATELDEIKQAFNNTNSTAEKAVFESKFKEKVGLLEQTERDLNLLSERANKKEKVLTQVGRVRNAAKKVDEVDKEIAKIKGRITGESLREIGTKAFWNATIPSLVGGAGSLMEAYSDLSVEGQAISDINRYLPEEQQIDNIGKAVGQSLQDFSEKISAEIPESAQKSMFSKDFNIESAANLMGSVTGSLASVIIPTGAVGLATKGSATALKLTQYGTGLSLGMNESYKAAKEAGLDDREAAILSFSIAIPVAMVDGLGADQFITKMLTPNVMKNAAKEAAKQLGKGASDKAIFDVATQTVTQTLKEGGKGFVTEGLTEAGQSLISSTGQELYDVSKGREFMSESGAFKNTITSSLLSALEEGIAGGLAGGVTSLSLLKNKSLYEKAVEIANNPQEMELFQKQLDREVKSGEITIDEANGTMNAIQAIAETETLIPPTIKDKDTRLAAVNIIAEKRLLEQQIEGKEKGLVEPQVERIKALDEGLKLISRGTSVEEVQNFLKPTEQITESALGEQLTTPTETINEEAVETPVTEEVTEEVVPQELTPTLEAGVQIEYSKNGGKTFEIGTIQANENGVLEVLDEDGTPNRVDTKKETTIINPIKTEENAVNQGNIEQSNISEYQGTVGQEQGQQEDRLNQEAVISQSQTETGGGDSVIESGQVQEEVVRQPKQFEGESWNNTGTNFTGEGNVKEFTAKNGQNYNITESEDNGNVFVSINDSNGENIASAYFTKQSDGTFEAKEVFTKEDLRGKNIAKAMYDYIDNYKGEILPSANQSEEGRGLWENNYKQQTKPTTQTDGTETTKQKTGSRKKDTTDAPKQKKTGKNTGKGRVPLDQRKDKDIDIVTALEIEPQDLEDYAMLALISRAVKITPESFSIEVLDGYEEFQKRLGILRLPKNGGVSVEKAAETIISRLPNGIFEQVDTQTVRNIIINLLKDNATRIDIAKKLREKYRIAPNTNIENGVLVNTSGEPLIETPYGLFTQAQLDEAEAEFALKEAAKDDDESLLETITILEDLTDEEIDALYNIKDNLEFEKAVDDIIANETEDQQKPLNEQIADAIRKGKTDGTQMATPLTLVWNTALEIAAKFMESNAGATVTEAIAKAVEYLRTTDIYKTLNESQQAKFEKNISDDIAETINKVLIDINEVIDRNTPPPTEAKPAKKQGGEERELSGFKSITALYKDKSIQDKLANTPNPLYTVMKNEETVRQVDKLIDTFEDELETILLDKVRVAQEDIPNSVRVVAMVKLANAYMQQSKNDEFINPGLSKVNYEKAINLLEKVAIIGKEYGQGIQAFANVIFGYGDFESAMFQFRKKVERANEKNKKETKKKAKKDIESISSDTDMAAQEAVEEVIKKYKPRKKKTIDEIKAVRKSIKAKLKSSKNKYFNSSVGGITLEGIKLSGELAKTYIEEGIVRAKDIIEKIKQDFLDEGYKITEADEKKINSEIGKVSLDVKLSTMDETLTQIAKQHYDTRKKKTKSLAKTIVDELGLTDVEAEQIAKEIEAEVESKLKDKLQKRFKKDLKTAKEKKNEDLQKEKKAKREEQKKEKGNDLDILLRAALDGDISEDLMTDIFAEKYGIANIDESDIDYIKEQYAALDKLKDKSSFIAFEFYGKILTRILSKIPQNTLDGFDLLWYSSTLSGPATQLMNATFGAIMSLNVAGESIVGAILKANANKIKNPKKHYGKSVVEWWNGAGDGLNNARYIFKNGSSSYADDITQLEKTAGNEFDFKRAIQPNNWFTKGATFLFEQAKYPLRTLGGTDVFFTKAMSKSQIARLIELKYAKEGLKGDKLAEKVASELLVTKEDLKKYDAQAIEEINVKYPNKTAEEIRDTLEYKRRMAELKNSKISEDVLYGAENLARESLLTRTPEGTPGQVYKVIAYINNATLKAAKNQTATVPRFALYGLTKILPFVKVPLNIIDLGYATSPLGFTRLINGKLLKYGEREMFLGRKEAIINRAILGTIITVAVAFMNAEDLWGEGLEGEEDEEKRNQMKKDLQDRYFEQYGEKLPLDHPLFNIPHEGQVSGSLSMLTKERRDFLTKNNLAKEQSTFIGGKWISNTLSPQWAILGAIGTLVNYNRYIVNNPYTTTSAEENKKSYLSTTSHVLGGLITQFLEMSSLKGSQTLASNLDFKNGDPFEKMVELSRTTFLQPLNILNPAIVRQTYKYFDQASVEKTTKERDLIGLSLFATQSFVPIVGAPIANYFSVERHDILGRTIKSAPGEGKDFLGTIIGYSRDIMNEEKNKEGDKIIDLLYMSGINGVPNFPDPTLYKVVGKTEEIVEIPFRERIAMDKIGKQMAAKEMEIRFGNKGDITTGVITTGVVAQKDGKVFIDNSKQKKYNSLSRKANKLGAAELSKTSDDFSQEINKIYTKYYKQLLNEYLVKNKLLEEKPSKKQ